MKGICDMREIITDKILSPEEFIFCCTGEAISIFHKGNIIDNIHAVLKQRNVEGDDYNAIWDYSLSDIDYSEDGRGIVLVDVSRFDTVGHHIKECRWFEVPDSFEPSRLFIQNDVRCRI